MVHGSPAPWGPGSSRTLTCSSPVPGGTDSSWISARGNLVPWWADSNWTFICGSLVPGDSDSSWSAQGSVELWLREEPEPVELPLLLRELDDHLWECLSRLESSWLLSLQRLQSSWPLSSSLCNLLQVPLIPHGLYPTKQQSVWTGP